jgi:hypothetical protein
MPERIDLAHGPDQVRGRSFIFQIKDMQLQIVSCLDQTRSEFNPKLDDSNRGSPMSKRSIYFRGQAAACRHHANLMVDVETQQQLRELADKFIVRAVEIEAQAGD